MSRPSRAACRAVIGLITLYQAFRGGQLSPCRFHPSCSVYAKEAVLHHGVLRGGWLAIGRLSRCRPRGGWGFDPVPS